MGILVLALIAVGIQPEPLITPQDYPQASLDNGEEGSVGVELIVNPSGMIENCTVFASSRYINLDKVTCKILRQRARFAVARNEQGKAIYLRTRDVVNWSIGGPIVARLRPDLELTINEAPAGIRLPVEVPVAYVLKTGGEVSSCRMKARSGAIPSASLASLPKVLVDLACREIGKTHPKPVVDQTGVPVEALDEATVKFSLN